MGAAVPGSGFAPELTRDESIEPAPATVPLPKLEALGRGSLLAGKYRLELLLGEGGMGFVWSAYNVELELPVAVKLLREAPKSAMLAQRFRVEARAAARLAHPSIVRVFDIAAADNGDPFIVMELLTGESLASDIARGRLTGAKAVQLMLPIAEGLCLAHEKGIVHRDLKPDNVFVCNDGQQLQPKLLDFGIAKVLHSPSGVERLTVKGTVLGSLNYMSPEQARGDEVDARSDIWSYCVVLYEAISGRVPFRGADKRSLIDAIMNDEPAPLPAGVDERLVEILHWGLAKDPAERPRSMRELGKVLARWLFASGVSLDACGALVTRWEPRPVAPSSGLPKPTATPAATPPNRDAVTIACLPIVTRALPTRARRLAVLGTLALLLVGGSGAWSASAQSPEVRIPATGMVQPIASPEPVSVAPPAIAAEPASPQAATAASTSPPPPIAPQKPPTRPAASIARLPFH